MTPPLKRREQRLDDRPNVLPNGIQKASRPASGTKSERHRGLRTSRRTGSEERVIKARVSAKSRFKGNASLVMQDLVLGQTLRYRRKRWTAKPPPRRCYLRCRGTSTCRFLLARHRYVQVTAARLPGCPFRCRNWTSASGMALEPSSSPQPRATLYHPGLTARGLAFFLGLTRSYANSNPKFIP